MRRTWGVWVVLAGLGCSGTSTGEVGTHELACCGDPLVINNCNYDSEEKAAADNVSNEDDIQPCGSTVVVSHVVEGAGGSNWAQPDEILVDTWKSDVDPEDPETWDPLATSMRFCRCDPAALIEDTAAIRTACEADLAVGGECELNDAFGYNENDVWKTPTVRYWQTYNFVGGNDDECCGAGSSCCPDALRDPPEEPYCNGDADDPACCDVTCVANDIEVVYGPEVNGFYFQEMLFGEWSSGGDAETWGATEDPEEEYDMPGVLWTHTVGPLGAEYEWEDEEGVEQQQLTSHYTSTNFGRQQIIPDSDDDGLWYVGPFVPEEDCVVCEGIFPAPVLFFPPDVGLSGGGDPEIRTGQGALPAAGFFASGALTNLANIAGAWVDAAEPYEALAPTSGARFAKVATNGTAVNAHFKQSTSGLTRTTPSKQGGSPPSARSEFGTVLSYWTNRVYVIGGVNGSGTPFENMYSFNMSTNSWTQHTFSGSVKPQRVVAATYSPWENELIVLDKVGTTSFRLLQFGTTGGSVTTLASWTNSSAGNTLYGLAVEYDGNGYVIACGGSSGHTLLRLDAAGTSTAITHYAEATSVLETGLVRMSEIGASVYVAGTADPTPVGYRQADLEEADSGTPGLCF